MLYLTVSSTRSRQPLTKIMAYEDSVALLSEYNSNPGKAYPRGSIPLTVMHQEAGKRLAVDHHVR